MTKKATNATTPMMQQFYAIKQKHPDKILFYRMGDFYEMFGDDAVKASKVLQIQLTTRNKNQENAIPLCGVPIHAYDQYLNKLTRAGFKVAVCEQTEDPAKAKGLVKREVVRIVTPGTIIADDLLESESNSFLSAIWANKKRKKAGIACCDLTTGEFELEEVSIKKGWGPLLELLYLYRPKELLLPSIDSQTKEGFHFQLVEQIRQINQLRSQQIHIEYLDSFDFDLKNNQRTLQDHFAISSLSGFGIDNLDNAVRAAGAVFNYLAETQQDTLKHITKIKRLPNDDRMILDESTIRNLELFETADGSDQKQSLIYLLDRCKTPMGSRKLRRWLSAPLKTRSGIEHRLDQVTSFFEDQGQADKLRQLLSKIIDLERITARISMPQTNIQDLVRLRGCLEPLETFKKALNLFTAASIRELENRFDPLVDVFQLLQSHILPEPSLKTKDGGFIHTGIDKKLDELVSLMRNGKQHIANMEADQKKKTGITSLKIGYNKVFGYFIEISNASKHLVPDTYIRKQTLVNNERFVTEELKELEESILTAEDESKTLELEILRQIKERVQKEIPRIQESARIIAEIDVLCAFANLASTNNFSRPQLDDNPNHRQLSIVEGRHPVIESLVMDEPFIPNSLNLDSKDQYILVITGPNMGGKSTYMRQTALIALMAQIGTYVPAQSATLPVFDRIFTRVGASDNLTRGQSTFMVEMSEAASILNNATAQSLIILDEIGRGTSTFDGISIAWSIIEHIHDLTALTLFATHYHELILLEKQLPGVKNAKVVVHEDQNKLVFLRKVIDGETDKSYGIQVARLAGLPLEVISRAENVIKDLKKAEKQLTYPEPHSSPGGFDGVEENLQMSFFAEDKPWIEKLKNYDINNHTPIQVMAFLDKIIREARD